MKVKCFFFLMVIIVSAFIANPAFSWDKKPKKGGSDTNINYNKNIVAPQFNQGQEQGQGQEQSQKQIQRQQQGQGQQQTAVGSVNIKEDVDVPPELPIVQFGEGPRGVSGTAAFMTTTKVYNIGGKKAMVIPADKVGGNPGTYSLSPIGDNYYWLKTPEGVYMVKAIGETQFEGGREGIIADPEMPEDVLSRALQKAVSDQQSGEEVFYIGSFANQAQTIPKSVMVPGSVKTGDGVIAGGLGKAVVTERNAIQVSLDGYIPLAGPFLCQRMKKLLPPNPPPNLMIKSDTTPPVPNPPKADLTSSFNKIAEVLASCQNLSPFNEAANMLNGKVHIFRYLYHGKNRADLVTSRLAFEQALRNPGNHRDTWLWLAFVQHKMGWNKKAKTSLTKFGHPDYTWDSVEVIVRSRLPKSDEDFSPWVDSELTVISMLSKDTVKTKTNIHRATKNEDQLTIFRSYQTFIGAN